MDTITTAVQPIHYPERDGKPMGETDVHIDILICLREALRDYFRNEPQMYVAGNMLFYYEEGNPAACGGARRVRGAGGGEGGATYPQVVGRRPTADRGLRDHLTMTHPNGHYGRSDRPRR